MLLLAGTGAARSHRFQLWTRTDERHYAIPALRWAASLLATRRADEDLRACASALARIVAETGTAEAVAALGHALGEVCLVDGSPVAALRAPKRSRRAASPSESDSSSARRVLRQRAKPSSHRANHNRS